MQNYIGRILENSKFYGKSLGNAKLYGESLKKSFRKCDLCEEV